MNRTRPFSGAFYVLLWASVGCFAQPAKPQPGQYVNQFQTFNQAKQLDSAFANAQQLALASKDLVNVLMHDSFAQQFLRPANPQIDTLFSRQLLNRLYTGNLPLRQSVYPLYKWVEIRDEIRDAPGDTARIRQLVNGFLVAQERSGEEKGNRIDRYALLLYALLRPMPQYAALADTVFARTYYRLEHAVNGFYYQATNEPRQSVPRAYFRYLMACAKLMKANESLAQADSAQAATYLQEASQFSPDDTDRMNRTGYFYEAAFLLNGQEDFHERYANFLLSQRDTSNAVRVLTELALADLGRIPLLKTYYENVKSRKTPFRDYWTQMLNARLKPAEPFRLTSLDGKTFDYTQHRGKWILIDFWGTWCKPCVAELPELEKFYGELAKENPNGIIVLTAACHDTEARVQAFMAKTRYTFPVAMVNEDFIRQFRVGEYPTKVLITPQGNRMKIPFGSNWAERVRLYAGN